MEEKENQNTDLKIELDICRQAADEYLNNWKRERADLINYRKDEAQRIEEIIKYGNESLILEFIEIIDDLELAAKHLEATAGIKRIIKKFEDMLEKHGVEKMEIGTVFNPSQQEAISTDDAGDNLEEVRAGYTMHGKVIRPARVKLIK